MTRTFSSSFCSRCRFVFGLGAGASFPLSLLLLTMLHAGDLKGQGYFRTFDLGAHEQAIQDVNMAGVSDHLMVSVLTTEAFFRDDEPSELHFYKIDSEGQAVDSFVLASGEFTYPSMMAYRDGGYDLITSFNAIEELRWGTETRRLDEDFNILSQQRIYLPEGIEAYYGDCPVIRPDGEYVIGGYYEDATGGTSIERLCAWRFSEELDELTFTTIASPEIPVVRSLDMLALSDSAYMALVFNWQTSPEQTYPSTTKLVRYDGQFDVIDINGDRSVEYPTGNLGPIGSIEPYGDSLLLAYTDLRGIGVVRDAQLSIIDYEYAVLDSIVLGSAFEGDDRPDKVLPRSLRVRDNGNILAVNVWNFGAIQASQGFGSHPTWIQIHELDSDLDLIYRRFFGGSRNYRLTDVLPTPDGGTIITGMYWDYIAKPDSVDLDAFILKVDAEGNYTSLDESGPEMIDLRVGPNPASTHFDITTSLQDFGLVIRDLNGREMRRERVLGGRTSVDTTQLPPGMYLYTIVDAAGGFELTERLVVE